MGSGIAVNATYSFTYGALGRRKFKGPLARTAGDANVDANAQRRELRRQLADQRRADGGKEVALTAMPLPTERP